MENEDVKQIREDVSDMKKGCAYAGCSIVCFVIALFSGLISLFLLGVL